MKKKEANRKPLIIVAIVATLLLLAAGGVYIANGLIHRPEVFRQILEETAQEDAGYLFKAGKFSLSGAPGLSFFMCDDNLQDSEGNYVTYEDLWHASTELSVYQQKVDDMVNDIEEYRVGDIVINGDDSTFAGMTTADVTFVFKWYDFDSVMDEFNKYYYNQLLPYAIVGSESSEFFPVIDHLMLSILEKVEDAGMTREYEGVSRYYLSEAGSNPITGEGASWSEIDGAKEMIREMILNKLNYSDQAKDAPSEEGLKERDDIVVNMSIAIELYGKDGAKELLETLGYEGLVAKIVADYTPPEESHEE